MRAAPLRPDALALIAVLASGCSRDPLPSAADLAAIDSARAGDLSAPDLFTPDLSIPDLSIPDLSSRDLSTRDLSIPDLSIPDLSTSDLSTRDLTPLPCDMRGGACGPDAGCPDNYGRCCNTCVPLDTTANCGTCGYACPTGTFCDRGICTTGCFERTAMPCDGTCRRLDIDPRHCGACGRACAAGQVCARGACVAACPSGLTRCGSSCVDLTTDLQHCGACDTRCCAGTFQCFLGRCSVFDCPAGLYVCTASASPCEGACTSAFCTDLAHDPKNCGGCGVACPTGQVCTGGRCQ